MVLGLQLIGAEVIYENGQVSLGAQTTYDNAGYCGSSIMTGGGGESRGVHLGATQVRRMGDAGGGEGAAQGEVKGQHRGR